MKWKVLVGLLAFNSLFANSSVLNLLERQCKTLPEGKEKQLIVKQLSGKLYNQIRKVMSKNGCEITWDKQNNKIIISKSESDEDLLAGLEDLDTNVDWLDERLAEKEEQVRKKEEEVKRTEEQVKRTEEEVRELEKMAKAQGYLGYLQKKVIFMGNHIENKKLINDTLDEILSNLKIDNLRDSRYGKNIKKVLDLIKIIHKDDKEISKKIDSLLFRLKLN